MIRFNETSLSKISPPSVLSDCAFLNVPSYFSNYSRSVPNVAFQFDHQNEHRRLSDGPSPPSLRRLNTYQYHRHPGDFGGSESCMLKQKNSSLSLLLDSTSSIMRSASSTFKCLIGSARRASYCGQPDPSVQLAPNATCGSLYLRSNDANSNDSSISNTSYDDQRRRVTIYDGRMPTTTATRTIPFDLMTPIEAITQTINDPVESFVQIVLETPDEQPVSRFNLPPTTGIDFSTLNRRRTSSSKVSSIQRQNSTTKQSTQSTKPTDTSSMTADKTEKIDVNQDQCQTPKVIEPMDFSFLEKVLGADDPPPPVPPRTHSLHICRHKLSHFQTISAQQNNKIEKDLIKSQTNSNESLNSNNDGANIDDRWNIKKSSFDDRSKFVHRTDLLSSID